ncbi:hypothetical protein [Thiocystis violascens]|uniref:Uncharacterized protein n=1 Tax=Thiocystis violascens (strain ATCC 17096 / DSM 198 / 6111) TaxID=765911 RepID=I3YD46_THIV6|nr:hypothetical protein [Thiocystis violascens]AFL74914.1 hypothetical protein Thivi_3034 [Thiocystis violascens DSM 198]
MGIGHLYQQGTKAELTSAPEPVATAGKALDPRERKTLLRLIATLCDLARLDLEQSYKTAEIIKVKNLET